MLVWTDAEECWGKMTEALKDVPLESGSETSSKKFVEAYMMGQMRRECVQHSPQYHYPGKLTC